MSAKAPAQKVTLRRLSPKWDTMIDETRRQVRGLEDPKSRWGRPELQHAALAQAKRLLRWMEGQRLAGWEGGLGTGAILIETATGRWRRRTTSKVVTLSASSAEAARLAWEALEPITAQEMPDVESARDGLRQLVIELVEAESEGESRSSDLQAARRQAQELLDEVQAFEAVVREMEERALSTGRRRVTEAQLGASRTRLDEELEETRTRLREHRQALGEI